MGLRGFNHLKVKACANLELQQLGRAAFDPVILSVWDLILCVLQHSVVQTGLFSVAMFEVGQLPASLWEFQAWKLFTGSGGRTPLFFDLCAFVT